MRARAHRTAPGRPPRAATGPAGATLPWWALALPALAFCALLTLLVAGAGADTAQRGGAPLARILERVQETLGR